MIKRYRTLVSDIATVIAVGCPINSTDNLAVKPLNMGEDGEYSVMVMTGDDIKQGIPGDNPQYPKYKKAFECKYWLKIYDDFGLSFHSLDKMEGNYQHFEIWQPIDPEDCVDNLIVKAF